MKRYRCSFFWGVIFTLILIALSPSADASVVAYQTQPLYATFGDPANYAAQPLYTTSGDPNNADPDHYVYVVSPPSAFDGVAEVIFETASGKSRGSGVLLWTGRHLLTAAHNLTDGSGALDVLGATVSFDLPAGRVKIAGVSFIPHPDWDGNWLRGNDIAIITLAEVAPAAAQRYDLYDKRDEVGKVGTKAGYGRSGQGQVQDAYPGGTKRSGQNLYDAVADLMLEWLIDKGLYTGDYIPGSVLQYDFDNRSVVNDGFGLFFGLPDTGLGDPEVLASFGDSGGPTFIDGKIAGIVSYGITLGRAEVPHFSDITPLNLDSSFGEFVGDTRVSFYADWIRTVIPEPSSIIVWSLLSGLAVVAGFRRARRR